MAFPIAISTAFQLFQVFRQGATIVIAIALAWSSLDRGAIGGYEMLLYIGYLVSFFWSNGLLQAMLSLHPKLSEEGQQQLYVQAFLLFSSLSALIIAGLWFGQVPVLRLLVQQDSIPYWSFFLVFLLTNIPTSLQEHFYLLEKQSVALLVYGLLSAGAQVVIMALPALLGYDFRWSFVGLVLLGVVKYFWLFLFVMNRVTWQWDGTILRTWWRMAWPLMVSAGLGAINVSIGAWMVGLLFAGDPAQFGIYRYGARELPLMGALTGALASAMIPVIAQNTAIGLGQLRRETARLQHILFPLSIVLLFTAGWWFPWIFSEEYRVAVPVFQTFLLLTLPYMIFARTVLIAQADLRVLPFFVIGGIGVHLLLCWWLGSHFGLPGVAMGSVAAFTLEKIAMIIYVEVGHGIHWRTYTAWEWWLGYSAILVGSYLLI
ncbi:MAG: hypothetical protein AAF840_04595 [Bacteroidota bacterium]